jgi:hypothetical protein
MFFKKIKISKKSNMNSTSQNSNKNSGVRTISRKRNTISQSPQQSRPLKNDAKISKRPSDTDVDVTTWTWKKSNEMLTEEEIDNFKFWEWNRKLKHKIRVFNTKHFPEMQQENDSSEEDE